MIESINGTKNQEFALLEDGAIRTLYEHTCVNGTQTQLCYNKKGELQLSRIHYDTASLQLIMQDYDNYCLTGNLTSHTTTLEPCVQSDCRKTNISLIF